MAHQEIKDAPVRRTHMRITHVDQPKKDRAIARLTTSNSLTADCLPRTLLFLLLTLCLLIFVCGLLYK